MNAPQATVPSPTAAADPPEVDRQLNDLRGLRDGWLWGEGLAPHRAGLDWLTAAFVEHDPAGLPRPHLYPTAEGGVQAEWNIGNRDVSLAINLSDRTGYWHDLDLTSGGEQACQLDLSRRDGWDWAAARLRATDGSSG